MMHPPKPIGVSELNAYLKFTMENDPNLRMLCVEGEVSNFVRHASGHWYFSLKDQQAAIKTVLFKGYTRNVQFLPKNGDQVLVVGNVGVYPRDGIYQLYAERMYPTGVGDVHQAREALVEKLREEGLFDLAHKKSIPPYATRIGVVSSPTGAVLHDIFQVLSRRFPLADILLYPVQVQGEEAKEQIVKGIEALDASGRCQVILLARGGGSKEDLAVFDEECVARAIFACQTPVISAIGHETDESIADYVADLRAPTPSAAAELAVPDQKELLLSLDAKATELNQRLKVLLKDKTEKLKYREAELCIEGGRRMQDAQRQLLQLANKQETAMRERLESGKSGVVKYAAALKALNPLGILARGYSMVKKEGAVVASVNELEEGDKVFLCLQDGSAQAQVIKKEEN